MWKIIYLRWFFKRTHKKYSQRSQLFTLTSANNLRKCIKIILKVHKNYKCDSCGKSFTVANKMRRHAITIYVQWLERFLMLLFWKIIYLRVHIKSLLEGHKEFKCDSCGESFTLHIAKLERSYQNNSWRSQRLQMWLLWKSFAGATSHGIHIKTYKDFKCEYCGKSFAQAGNLRV